MQPLIDEVRRTVLACGVSYEEFHTAATFLLDVGASGEVPLLLDALFEAAVDEAASRTSNASPSAIEGPYYVAGAPLRSRRA